MLRPGFRQGDEKEPHFVKLLTKLSQPARLPLTAACKVTIMKVVETCYEGYCQKISNPVNLLTIPLHLCSKAVLGRQSIL